MGSLNMKVYLKWIFVALVMNRYLKNLEFQKQTTVYQSNAIPRFLASCRLAGYVRQLASPRKNRKGSDTT